MTAGECLGIALGVCGMGLDDYVRLTPDEFSEAVEARRKLEERRGREMWECMRVLAAVSVSPYSKRGVDPRKLVRLAWDDEGKRRREPVSAAEDKRRLEAVMGRLKGKRGVPASGLGG